MCELMILFSIVFRIFEYNFRQPHLISVVALDKTLTGEGGGRRRREGWIVNTWAPGDGAL